LTGLKGSENRLGLKMVESKKKKTAPASTSTSAKPRTFMAALVEDHIWFVDNSFQINNSFTV
jgi:hypothetical protein